MLCCECNDYYIEKGEMFRFLVVAFSVKFQSNQVGASFIILFSLENILISDH